MSNNRPFWISLVVLALLSFPAFAQQPVPTVTDIVVDKTDKNAVVAREQAIVEAQRAAFRVLAEKSMNAEAFKAYGMPDNKTISLMVRDFQIKNEQMTANRYVAVFTVRFTSEIHNYISLPADLGTVSATGSTAAAEMAAASGTEPVKADETKTEAKPGDKKPAETKPAVTAGPARTILVLPYFVSASGKKILWEDPNPWRDAWQEEGRSEPAPHVTLAVPLGDLTDVSSGDTNGVWNGKYETVDKLQANYNAGEVALVVAQPPSGVDIYIYKGGKLSGKKSVPTQVSDYKKAIADVTAALVSPIETVEETAPGATPPAHALPELAAATEAKSTVAPTGGKVSIKAVMNFANFAEWMEAQKRMASISPPVVLEISSITRDAARFSIDYMGGGIDTLKAALAEKGVALNATDSKVYELSLTN